MKYILLLLINLQLLHAQTSEVNQSMSLGTQNGIKVSLENADAKYIEKVWRKFSKDFGKVKENKKAGEYYITDASVKSIRPEAMDLYASVMDNQIVVFFDLKNSFLNSKDHPSEYAAAQKMVQEFAYEVQREKIREELEEENDKLKKSQRGYDKLKKENTGYHKDIDEAKAKIKKAEQNIVDNEKEQVNAEAELKALHEIIQKIMERLDSVGKSK